MALPGVSTGSFRPMAVQNQVGRQQKDARDDALRNLLISTGTNVGLGLLGTGVGMQRDAANRAVTMLELEQQAKRDAALGEYYKQTNALGLQQEERLGEAAEYAKSRDKVFDARHEAEQEATNQATIGTILKDAWMLEEDPARKEALFRMTLENTPGGMDVLGSLPAMPLGEPVGPSAAGGIPPDLPPDREGDTFFSIPRTLDQIFGGAGDAISDRMRHLEGGIQPSGPATGTAVTPIFGVPESDDLDALLRRELGVDPVGPKSQEEVVAEIRAEYEAAVREDPRNHPEALKRLEERLKAAGLK